MGLVRTSSISGGKPASGSGTGSDSGSGSDSQSTRGLAFSFEDGDRRLRSELILRSVPNNLLRLEGLSLADGEPLMSEAAEFVYVLL